MVYAPVIITPPNPFILIIPRYLEVPELGIKWWPSSNDESENINRFYNASEKLTLFIKAMLESEEYDEFEPGMVVDVYQLLPEHYIKHLSGLQSIMAVKAYNISLNIVVANII